MKSLTLFLSILLVQSVYAQVAINTDNSSPNAAAMLDIKSTTKGILIPRMTDTERDNIASPIEGLTVYVTNENAFYFYDGIQWVSMGNDGDWLVNGDDIYNGNTGFVGIGTNSPVANLDVNPGTLNGTVTPLRIVVNAQVTPGSSNGYSLFKGSGGTTYSGGVVYGLNLDLSGGTNGRNYGVYIEGETGNYFSNKVGIRTNAPEGVIHIVREDDQRRQWPIFQIASDRRGYRSNIVLRRSRGTIDLPDVVEEDDVIATYDTQAYDGDEYIWTANMTVTVDDTVSNDIIPSRINFNVTDDAGDKLHAVVIKSTGRVGIGVERPKGALHIKSQTGALIIPKMTTSERNALPTVNGSIIYNKTTKKFNFYEDGAWRTLD